MNRPFRTLLRIFVKGALAALPLAATVLIFVWAANLLLRWLGPDSGIGRLLISIGLGVGGSELVGYALGIAIVAALIFGLGLLIEVRLQRRLFQALNGVVHHIPLVSSVYDLLRKIVAVIAPHDNAAGGLHSMSAVWCHFGGPGASPHCAALALLGSDVAVMIDGQRCLAVLVPTAPVPVGGGLLYVPEHWVTPAAIGVDAVTSIYVSMGLTSPQYLPLADTPRTAPEPGADGPRLEA